MRMKTIICMVAMCFCACCISDILADKKLIVILIHGLKWDNINDSELKGIPRIIKNGVRAPYTIPVFPSLAYPNYLAITTGLYPESSGFVSNYLYDQDTGSFFGMIPGPGTTDQKWWNASEPIWITAERNHKRAALYWWPGCEVQISGTHPSICERQNTHYGPPYEAWKLDFLDRIDDIIQMFKPADEFISDRLSLALFFYGSVDYAGHHSGPNSAEVKESLYDIDDIIDQIQTKIVNAGLEDDVNIMVISDHGMTEVRKGISLEKFQVFIKYQIDFGAISMILPQPGMMDRLYEELKNEKIKGLVVYKKEEIPEHYHIKHSKLVLPIYLMAKKGYHIEALTDRKKKLGDGPFDFVATHGYDPLETPDMRGIFVARGPDFLKGYETAVLYNTDYYNIMCNILNIRPLPNNGSFERVKPMLAKYQPHVYLHASSAAEVGYNLYYLCVVFVLVYTKLPRQ